MSSDLRRLPSIDALLRDRRLADHPHDLVVRVGREVVEEARSNVRAGCPPPSFDAIVDAVRARLRGPRKRRVINATGIVVHTNLGRAPLAPEAIEAVAALAGGYADLELDLETGRRGGRLAAVVAPLRLLTGAEDAVVVNNCAAAVLLALTALARGRSVIVSRGELVEIGGSFRVPEVIAAGGARLVEVGTTNRTRVEDYARAIDDETAVILRVHPSNFRLVGFSERPERSALAELAHRHGLPLVEDLGSGLLGPALDGVDEVPVDRAVAAGVDLVCFSGDKLLGGPQAGAVVGRASLVQRLRQHPLYRALRADKMALAALSATLRLYVEGRENEVPVRAMLGRNRAWCQANARALAARIPGAVVEDDIGYTGGGSLPDHALPTSVVAVRDPHPNELARRLRAGEPPVVARVARNAVLIDPRTLLPGDEDRLIEALRRARGEAPSVAGGAGEG